MNYKILTAVSALTLVSVSPIAGAQNNPDTPPAATITKEDIKRGWENTKKAVTETVEDIEYTVLGEERGGADTNITADATTKGLLKHPVYSANNKHIGTLKDIIIDQEGKAMLVVVSDAKLIDFGAKEAAFDYGMVLRRNEKGDVIMPLTEETIRDAQEFSYKAEDAGKENMRTIPAGGHSVEELLKANIINPAGDEVASVDNITFRSGRVDALIVGFDKVLGMGGKKAALRFSDVKIIDKADGDVAFLMTAAQTAHLESFKQAGSN